jgi:hypothetical protein
MFINNIVMPPKKKDLKEEIKELEVNIEIKKGKIEEVDKQIEEEVEKLEEVEKKIKEIEEVEKKIKTFLSKKIHTGPYTDLIKYINSTDIKDMKEYKYGTLSTSESAKHYIGIMEKAVDALKKKTTSSDVEGVKIKKKTFDEQKSIKTQNEFYSTYVDILKEALTERLNEYLKLETEHKKLLADKKNRDEKYNKLLDEYLKLDGEYKKLLDEKKKLEEVEKVVKFEVPITKMDYSDFSYNIMTFQSSFKKIQDANNKYNRLVDEYNDQTDDDAKDTLRNDATELFTKQQEKYDELRTERDNLIKSGVQEFYEKHSEFLKNIEDKINNKLIDSKWAYYGPDVNKYLMTFNKGTHIVTSSLSKKAALTDIGIILEDLTFKYLTFESMATPTSGTIDNAFNFFNDTSNKMVKFVAKDDELDPKKEIKKIKEEKEEKEEKPYNEEELKKLKQLINKENLVAAIKRAFPEVDLSVLNSMELGTLIQISKELGITNLNADILKPPSNATMDEIQLIRSLEQQKRLRLIDEEMKKLRKTGIETDEQKKEKQDRINKSTKIIKGKSNQNYPTYKANPKETKLTKEEKKYIKDNKDNVEAVPVFNEQQILGMGISDKKLIKNLLKIQKDNIPKQVKLRSRQLLGMGKKKKNIDLDVMDDLYDVDDGYVAKPLPYEEPINMGGKRPLNAYMLFMKDFREKNKGKYTLTEMVKYGAEEYRRLKSQNKLPTVSGALTKKPMKKKELYYEDELDYDYEDMLEDDDKNYNIDYHLDNSELSDQPFYQDLKVEKQLQKRYNNFDPDNDGGVKLAMALRKRYNL